VTRLNNPRFGQHGQISEERPGTDLGLSRLAGAWAGAELGGTIGTGGGLVVAGPGGAVVGAGTGATVGAGVGSVAGFLAGLSLVMEKGGASPAAAKGRAEHDKLRANVESKGVAMGAKIERCERQNLRTRRYDAAWAPNRSKAEYTLGQSGWAGKSKNIQNQFNNNTKIIYC